MYVNEGEKSPLLNLKINDVKIEQVTSFKYLVVWISDNLSWSAQHLCQSEKASGVHLPYIATKRLVCNVSLTSTKH